MKLQIYQTLHVVSLLLLTGFTFSAFANPAPERRRVLLAWTGVFSLLALIAGFGMLAVMGYGFPGWIIVKLVCWLFLTGLTGMVFRRRERAPALGWVAGALIAIAVVMVYFKPF